MTLSRTAKEYLIVAVSSQKYGDEIIAALENTGFYWLNPIATQAVPQADVQSVYVVS